MISLFLAGTLIAQATSDVTTTQQPASPTAAETKTSDQATKPPQQVDTIVVTARAPTRESRIDRVVYDVRTLPDAPASAAVDAIGLLPGVFVGANNRITMVGGAFVTVLVDGKSMPRAAALQIPANQIARIEVMSNPPAEFASSAQAVINIITKKAQEDDKLGGTLAGSINTIDNQAMTLSFNKGMKPWSFNGFLRVANEEEAFWSRSEGVSGTGANRELESGIGTGQLTATNVNVSLRAVRKLSNTNSLSLSSSYFTGEFAYEQDSIETRTLANSRSVFPIFGRSWSPASLQYHSVGFNSEKEDKYKFDVDLTFSDNLNKSSYQSQRGEQWFSNRERKQERTLEFETSFEKTFSAGRVLSLGTSYKNEDFEFAFSDLGYVGPSIIQALKASYSQGTTPGSLAELSPFRRAFGVDYATEGNPKLEPADRLTFELTHEVEKNGVSLVTTAFYRDTKNELTFGSRLIENNVVLATSVNLSRSEATGVGSTLKGKLGKKLTYNFSWEVSEISFSDPRAATGQSRVEEIQSNGKASIDYKPTPKDQFVFSTTFKSDEYSLGSIEEGVWTNSIQYTRRLPKKVSLVVTVTNIGVETDRRIRSFGPDFSSESRSSNPSRALKVALSKTF